MDHMKVLKRAWQILWSYKALWIFGIILALTTSSGSNSGGNGGQHFTGTAAVRRARHSATCRRMSKARSRP